MFSRKARIVSVQTVPVTPTEAQTIMTTTSRVTATKKLAAALGLVAACFAPALGLTSAQAAVLWDQPLSTAVDGNNFPLAGNAYLSTQFSDFPNSSTIAADNFSNPVPWLISTIYVPGDLWDLTPGTDLSDADALGLVFLSNAAGVPGTVFAIGSVTPSDSQVVLSTGTSGLLSNMLFIPNTPLLLPAGDWWLGAFATMSFGNVGNWGRQVSDTTNGPIGQAINPGGDIDPALTNWGPITFLGAPAMDLAFRLEGTALTTGVSAPATVLLMAGGLAGLGLRVRRSATARKAA